jgi:hypothetical protein
MKTLRSAFLTPVTAPAGGVRAAPDLDGAQDGIPDAEGDKQAQHENWRNDYRKR